MPSPLTPTATLVLSVLLEEPMHPYEILCRLAKRRDDRLVRLSAGAVYHAVEKLHAGGLITECGSERHGRRPERTMYAVTEAGRRAHGARTRELLVERAAEYPSFPVGLALIHDLEPASAATYLRERRDALAAKNEDVRSRLRAVVAAGLPRRFLLDGFYELHQAEAEVDWLTAVVDDIDSGALNWTEQPAERFRAASAAIDKENS